MKLKIKTRKMMLLFSMIAIGISPFVSMFTDLAYSFLLMIVGFVCLFLCLRGATEQRELEDQCNLTQEKRNE